MSFSSRHYFLLITGVRSVWHKQTYIKSCVSLSWRLVSLYFCTAIFEYLVSCMWHESCACGCTETVETISGEIKVWNIGIAYSYFAFEFWGEGGLLLLLLSVFILFSRHGNANFRFACHGTVVWWKAEVECEGMEDVHYRSRGGLDLVM